MPLQSLATVFPPTAHQDAAAIEAIRNTLALCAFAIDVKDFVALSSVFTQDAIARFLILFSGIGCSGGGICTHCGEKADLQDDAGRGSSATQQLKDRKCNQIGPRAIGHEKDMNSAFVESK